MEFIVVAIIGLCILVAVFLSYFLVGEFALDPSVSNVDWGSFGSYFGGVSGPLLSFISVLLLVYTLRQQRFQLVSMSEENTKHDMLRYLEKLDGQIAHLLTRQIHVGNMRYVEIGDMVSGIENPAELHEASFKAALDKLLKLTAIYCEAIALYRENVNGYFIFRAHQQKALELVNYLDGNKNRLSEMAGPTLEFCKMHNKHFKADAQKAARPLN